MPVTGRCAPLNIHEPGVDYGSLMNPKHEGDVPAQAVALKSHRRVPNRSTSEDAGETRATFAAVGADRASEEWLVGGGEMAKAIKALNWSRLPSADGDLAPSLRTTVSLVQASNSPISLVWGPGHVQI